MRIRGKLLIDSRAYLSSLKTLVRCMYFVDISKYIILILLSHRTFCIGSRGCLPLYQTDIFRPIAFHFCVARVAIPVRVIQKVPGVPNGSQRFSLDASKQFFPFPPLSFHPARRLLLALPSAVPFPACTPPFDRSSAAAHREVAFQNSAQNLEGEGA